MALLTLTDVAKTYDANRPLLTGVSFVIGEEDRVGLIGPNGAGKSTLLRILCGLEEPDAGERVVRRGLHIGFLEQEPHFDGDLTIRAVVRSGLAQRDTILAELDELHRELERGDLEPSRLASLLARQERLDARLEAAGGHDVEHMVEATIDGVGLPDAEARCATLSGGEARRVALARLLVSGPDLLLLDEPTNHLDAFVVAWLEERLARMRVPLVLVTHDRYLLDRVVDRIVEIDRGGLFAYEGSYSRYVVARAERLAAEERAERSRLNLLRRETAWMRRGPLARSAKAKARIDRYVELVGSEPVARAEDLEMAIPKGPRLGARVVTLEAVSHSFGAHEVLPPMELELTGAMRLGVVGPNGAGKSTLINIVLGRLEPSSGTVSVGETVAFGTIDQKRSDLDPTKPVVREVAGESDYVQVGGRRIHVAGFLDRFLFPGPKKDVPISALSGGERGRVLLAKLMLTGANVLVLDEPTNDLDLATMRALEEALCAFEGAVVVISHDRWFLDRVATHVLHLDGKGGAHLHTGDVSSLMERQAGVEQREPKPAPERPKPSTRRRTERKGLSPWERRELEELTERVSKLEVELEAVDTDLADPGVYAGGGEQARLLQERRGKVSEDLAGVMARWEELAERDE